MAKPASQTDKLIAGGAAGLAESFITYPTEYIKTRQQLTKTSGHASSPFKLLVDTLRQPRGVQALYAGAGAFCSANAIKSAVRFFAFDAVRAQLPTHPSTGKPTSQSNVLAGLAAGVAESVLVVTPGETFKTKLIDDRARAGGPHFRGSLDALRKIVAAEGPAGLYKGVLPVTLKQSSNAMVRFTSYNFFSDMLEKVMSQDVSSMRPVIAGAAAGVVTVYATMPFDTIKTQLQALNGARAGEGTLTCCTRVIREQGVWALWRGTTPRLMRLIVSGAISFAIYEHVQKLLGDMRATTGRQDALLGA